MAVSAVIQNGSVVETASQTSVSSSTSSNGTYTKDDFLQLLVAQMKYQNPLSPSDNTEYITQYATFSQVEQMQNMSNSMTLSRASSMVGQSVQVSTEDSNGNSQTIEGVVDFVKYENNKAYVSIGGNLYSVDSVTAVIDTEYADAIDIANSFANTMNSLPKLSELTLSSESDIATIRTAYNSLTSYQKSYIDQSYVDLLESYVKKISELKAASETSTESGNTSSSTNSSSDSSSSSGDAVTTE